MRSRPAPLTEAIKSFAPHVTDNPGDAGFGAGIETFSARWLSTGPLTEEFETAVKAFVGAPHAVAVNSGSAALHLALCALGVSENDGVVTSPLAHPGAGHAIMYSKARPFLIDIESNGFHLDPEKVRCFLEKECMPGPGGRPRHKATGKTIKAILPAHFAGIPCRMQEFLDLAETYRLWLIEDAGRSIGAEYRSRKIGGFGHLTCFDFGSSEGAPTGQGGLLITSDEDLARKARLRSAFGISDVRRSPVTPISGPPDVAALGFNYAMMDIQAAAALYYFRNLELTLAAAEKRASRYEAVLTEIPGLVCPARIEDVRPAWQSYPVLLPEVVSQDTERIALRNKFQVLGLETGPTLVPLHLHSFYQRSLPYRVKDFPLAEAAAQRLLNLPTLQDIPLEAIESAAEITAAWAKAVHHPAG